MWDELEPNFDWNDQYIGNVAWLYGNNIACFAQNLVAITASEYNDYVNMGALRNDGRMLQSESKGSTTKTLENQVSGDLIEDIFIALVDKYGTIVGNDITSKLTVRVDITYNDGNPLALEYDPVLTGASSFEAIGGVFNASGISFTGSPGYSYSKLYLLYLRQKLCLKLMGLTRKSSLTRITLLQGKILDMM